MLKIALGKGRIVEALADYLNALGDPLGVLLKKETRRLIIHDQEEKLEFIMVKPADLAIYVESGAADLGIIGGDVLLEGSARLYQLLDLKLSQCRMVLAGLPEQRHATGQIRRIATKYPETAKRYFAKYSQPIEIIKLEGSIELAPMVGLADAIVDIVESGRTLRDNGLVEYETIGEITSRLVANRVSYKLKNQAIEAFIKRLNQKGETACL